MQTKVEVLYKADVTLNLGWEPEPEAVASYKIYVGLVDDPTALTLLEENISARVSEQPGFVGKVAYNAAISDVIDVLGISSTNDFSNTAFYFAITWVDSAGSESSIADSIVTEALPVGIVPKYRKDDPTVNRFMFGFSEEEWRWVKLMASSGGALITSSSSLYAPNTITEYTYDGTNLSTEKSYFSDRTDPGSPAKLITYEYSGSQVTKVTVMDSTV